MAIEVTVTENVTTVSVSDSATTVDVSPQVTEVGVAAVDVSSANTATGIALTPTGNISATNVQAAFNEIGANEDFTTTLKTKLDGIEEGANADTFTAGDNINIDDGEISADVVGALSAGTNITISEAGEISASSISLTDVYTADSEAEHLSLSPTPDQGDVVIRTDENKTYIHNGGTAGTMADYTELASSNGVQSINGATGIVTFGKTNLDGYNANEFIDWTASHATPIHADNYTNTTYTAGTNISISDQNVISATGGGGGETYTAGSGIDISDSNVISWSSTSLVFEKVEFAFNDTNTPSGVYFENYEVIADEAGFAFKYDDPDTNEDPVFFGAITTAGSQFAGETTFTTSIKSPLYKMSGFTFAQLETGAGSQDGGQVRLSNTSVATATEGSDNLLLANTEYVDRAITNSGFYTLPDTTDQEDKSLTVGSDGIARWERIHKTQVLFAERTDLTNAVQIGALNSGTNAVTLGGTITGSGAVTVTYDNSANITISADPDGLPAQSESTDGYVLQSDGTDASWANLSTATLPTQTGNSGKYLTTDGTNASWDEVDAYPSQTGNAGKALVTNGVTVSWGDIDAYPDQSGNSGKFLSTDGSTVTWADVQTSIPSQSGHANKYLVTDGSSLSWATVSTAGQTGNITFSGSTISSSDTATVTIDDDLVADDITAESLSITSASAPSAVSNSSFEITAPDGVTHNGIPLPSYQGMIYIVGDGSTIGSWQGNSGVSVSKVADAEIQLTLDNRTDLDRRDYYVIANFNTTLDNPGSERYAQVSVSQQDDGVINLKLRDQNNGTSLVGAGVVVVQVYEV